MPPAHPVRRECHPREIPSRVVQKQVPRHNDEGMEGVLVYKTGATHLVVYPSEFAGTNKANAVVWDCGQEFNAIVADLRAKGVTFERYEMEGASYKDGVYDANGFKMVWFKDPDGNILHLNSA